MSKSRKINFFKLHEELRSTLGVYEYRWKIASPLAPGKGGEGSVVGYGKAGGEKIEKTHNYLNHMPYYRADVSDKDNAQILLLTAALLSNPWRPWNTEFAKELIAHLVNSGCFEPDCTSEKEALDFIEKSLGEIKDGKEKRNFLVKHLKDATKEADFDTDLAVELKDESSAVKLRPF